MLHARQTSCPSDFALVLVDFEPRLPGVTLETAAEYLAREGTREEHRQYREAFLDGVRTEVDARSLDAAVALVLRELVVHEVDSHERAFHWAGRLAVRACLERLTGRAPRPKRPRPRR
ncbi:hypothetical protein ACL02R_06655 [Streptomyces sp. MS19]|uniref:hypothetical protein n=1 Tax=Streptomyces sp. MS19 TaxID=3385972 RepID=UPI0039A329FE